MVHKKEHLEGLISLVVSLSKSSENEWFKNELLKRIIGNDETSSKSDERFLWKVLGMKFKAEAHNRYRDVLDNNLKQELCRYYKAMRIAYLHADYPQYATNFTLQLETIFSYLVNNLNAWKVVRSTPVYRKNPIKIYEANKFPVNLYDSFISKDGDDRGLSKISYKDKALFCLDYYNIDFGRNWFNFLRMYELRNFDCHATIASDNSRNIKTIEEFPENIGFYETTLKVFSSVIILYFRKL